MKSTKSGASTSGMEDGEVVEPGPGLAVPAGPKGKAGAIPNFNDAPQYRTVLT